MALGVNHVYFSIKYGYRYDLVVGISLLKRYNQEVGGNKSDHTSSTASNLEDMESMFSKLWSYISVYCTASFVAL